MNTAKRLIAGTFASLLIAAPAWSTTINFDDLTLNDYDDIPNTYGDNDIAGGTSNIAIDYLTRSGVDNSILLNNLDFWNNGYGDLSKVAFSVYNGSYAEIVLKPEVGWAVNLISFDMAGWFETDRSSGIFINYDATSLNLSTTVAGSGPSHSSFAPNVTYGGDVTIRWGADWNVGIDNISFRQIQCGPNVAGCVPGQVPEPASLALLGIGLASLGFMRRRRT